MAYKWKPSKAAKTEFANKMKEIEQFCKDNGIQTSMSGDSYYFTIGDQEYRVSNHSVEASNKGAFREDIVTGEMVQVRDLYHSDGRKADVIYIHASKTRIIDIYNDLKNGYQLDGRGYRKVI